MYEYGVVQLCVQRAQVQYSTGQSFFSCNYSAIFTRALPVKCRTRRSDKTTRCIQPSDCNRGVIIHTTHSCIP